MWKICKRSTCNLGGPEKKLINWHKRHLICIYEWAGPTKSHACSVWGQKLQGAGFQDGYIGYGVKEERDYTKMK